MGVVQRSTYLCERDLIQFHILISSFYFTEDFKTYLSDQENIEPLANEEIEARKMGINSVPTFIVNRQIVINGAQTSENFDIIFKKLTNNIN